MKQFGNNTFINFYCREVIRITKMKKKITKTIYKKIAGEIIDYTHQRYRLHIEYYK